MPETGPKTGPGETIVTRRLQLRRMVPEDAAALHAIFRDPEAMRYWSTLPHQDPGVTEAWLADTIARHAEGCADDFAVVVNDAVIGKAGLWDGREVGVILSRDRWGQGLAAEALRAVIGRAFARGVRVILADIDPRNGASLALFEKLGFRRTGYQKATIQLGDVWADSVYLELTPEQWSSDHRS